MALIKSKTNNQEVTYEYWVAQPIMNSNDKTTSVLMLGYKDKTSRDSGSAFIERVKVQGVMDKIYPTGKKVYAFAKRSIMTTEGSDIEGSEEVVEVESNWFADAVGDLE